MSDQLNKIFHSQICAVVTTYFPEQIFLDNMKIVNPQVGAIVVVDNTASDESLEILNKFKSTSDKAIVIKNVRNEGTATALNQGIRRARELGYPWVFTLDQDSLVDINLIKTYLSFIQSYPNPQQLGIINSNYKDKETGMLGFSSQRANQNGWSEVYALITSGSILSVSTFDQVGPLRDDFFMDWADYDFCLRARKLGKRNYVYVKPLVVHSIGAKVAHRFFFWILPANNHNPFRCYLIGRNLVVMIKKHFFREFLLVVYFILILFYKVFSIVLWEDKKNVKLKNFFIGIKDGIINQMSNHKCFLDIT